MRRPLAHLLLCAPALAQTWSVDFVEPFTNFTQDVRALPNGKVAVSRGVGQTAYHLTLLDSDGSLLWDRRWWIDIDGIAVNAANEIAVSGWTYPDGSTTVLDDAGSYVFAREGSTHGGVAEDYFYGAAPLADGGWVFTGGHTHDSCDLGMLVRRLDASGGLVWDARVGSNNLLLDLPGYAAAELADGSILVGARRWPNPMLMKFDASGGLLWKKSYAIGQCLRPQMAVDAAAGRAYLVAGGSYPGSSLVWDDDFTVLAVDASGGALWQRQYPGDGAEVANDLVVTPDGGLLVVGSTSSFGSAGRDMWLVRMDQDGDVLWQHTYGGDGDDEVNSVDVHPHGGFVLGCNLRDPSSNEWRGAVMRVDDAGRLSGCEPFPTWAKPEDISATEQDPIGDELLHTDTLAGASPCAPDATAIVASSCFESAVGSAYCSPAAPNSTGAPAALTATGSTVVSENALAVVGTQLPEDEWGYFVTGMGAGISTPPGSQGQLCLGGQTVHRFVSQVQNADSDGTIGIEPDLLAIPGHGAIAPGETWNFQLWYRDQNPGSTSNFSDALAVSFQ